MGNRKLLSSDLDGTVLFGEGMNKSFRDEDLKAIGKFQKEGNVFTINSGRGLLGLTIPLEGNIDWDYIICSTGACIVDRNKNIIYKKTIPFDAIRRMYEAYGKDDEISFNTFDEVYIINLKHDYGNLVKGLSSPEELKNEDIYGWSFHFESNFEAKEFVAWMKENGFDEWMEPYININDVDIAPKGCSKGIALHYLAKHLDITLDHVYAIGDAANDIQMLDAVENSFTFHSSTDEVKAVTKGQVDSVKELLGIMEENN